MQDSCFTWIFLCGLFGVLGIFYGLPFLLAQVSVYNKNSQERWLRELPDKFERQWSSAGHTIRLRPIRVDFEDDLTTDAAYESTPGVLGIVDDRVECYEWNERILFALAGDQLRAYGNTYQGNSRQIMLCGETKMGWHGYRLTLSSLTQWANLSAALHEISQVSPSTMHEPITAVGYHQDILGHWEQTGRTTLFLTPERLLLNWWTTIALDQMRELSVLPAQGVNPFNAAMLCIKYTDAEGHLQTIGFDILGGQAHPWATLLHQQSGAPLSVVEERKKKA